MAKMMMMGGSMWVLGLVVSALIASPVKAISCQDAVRKLIPCQAFLLGIAIISQPCCQGAQALNQLAKSKPDRQAVCECFKKVGPSLGIKIDRAKQIPQLCKINVGVPIDYSVDCRTV